MLYTLNWYVGWVVAASSPSLLPRAVSGKSRNALQDKAWQSTYLLLGSLRWSYFSAFILTKSGGRE